MKSQNTTGKRQETVFTNQHGEFTVKIGDEIACFPYATQFNKVVGLDFHDDCRVITVLDESNNYDTRMNMHVCAVR